ncbi:Ankyrin repeat domain-containing protein 50, partial [Madurella mycetomatis]
MADLDPELYTVAWFAPLEIEARAAVHMLDREHQGRFPMGRGDDYVFQAGEMCGHNIIIATLPAGQEYGTGSAAALASQVKRFFPNLWFGLLVGVAAGLPNLSRSPLLDIRLGDVLVGLPAGESAGLIAYDLGKETGKDGFQLLHFGHVLARTETVVRSAIGSIQRMAPNDARAFLPYYEHIKHEEHANGTFVDPGQEMDTLYQADEDGTERLVKREQRPDSRRTRVWYGPIGSGDKLVKNARIRDELRDKYSIIGLEMEAAGTMNRIPVGVIRGVCDYGDEHKNKEWQPYAAAMAAAYAKAILAKIGPKNIARRGGSIVQSGPAVEDPARKAKEIEVLKRLNKSPYQNRKDRNPDRVPGTCDWFVSHELFRGWQESESSRMLWVSADPGCGKSVLAKYLVDSILPADQSRTGCYFFFKDDFEDQKSVLSALCCILRQLFLQKPILLSDAILHQFDIDGGTLTSSFSELWKILIKAARDESAGEIICLLDALDECEDQGRSQLARELCRLYGPESSARNFNLKFLLTSRPYRGIYSGFRPLEIPGLPVIHLSGEGENEMKKISREIDIFIKARVNDIATGLDLTRHDQNVILQQLMTVPHRTYLWVYLTLNLLESDIDKEVVEVASKLRKKVHEAASQLPKTVDAAYDRILSKSRNPQVAKEILHIVVAAARPLTLREMNVALVLRKGHQSYKTFALEPEHRFRENIRDICGLFVAIIDSKIYLLHQTVKEFLVPNDSADSPSDPHEDLKWKHSLQPRESHRILAEICTRYLLLAEFETHPLDENGPLSQYVDDYIFLDYSAKYWAVHFRELQIGMQDMMIQSILRICDTNSKRCLTWFRVYWTCTNADFPRGFTTLMIVSYFGLRAAVKRLLKMGDIDLKHRDDTYHRSSLSWAAGNGFDAVVKLLIKRAGISLLGIKWPFGRGPEINSVDKHGRTPLSYAVWSGNVAIVKLLIQAGAQVDIEDNTGGTPLSYAVCSGHREMMKLLLERENQVGPEDVIVKELLFSAAKKGDEGVVQLLLDTGKAKVDSKDNNGRTPLSWAASNGHHTVAKLLLDSGADPNSKDGNGRAPLLYAAENGHEDVIKRLLVEKANVNAQDNIGFTALHWVAQKGHEGVMSLLLKNLADIEKKDKYGATPLAWTIEIGFEIGIKMLLAKDAEVNYWYTQ